jgi:hypothetical protein
VTVLCVTESNLALVPLLLSQDREASIDAFAVDPYTSSFCV